VRGKAEKAAGEKTKLEDLLRWLLLAGRNATQRNATHGHVTKGERFFDFGSIES